MLVLHGHVQTCVKSRCCVAQCVTCKRDKSGSLDAICMIIYILLNRAEHWPGITVQSGGTSF